MRKFLCFIDSESVNQQLYEFLNTLDGMGDEIYLFTNVSQMAIEPIDILCELDKVYERDNEAVSYIFLTNMNSLLQIVYRIYHQVFHQFVYFHQDDSTDYNISGIYRNIFSQGISESEMLSKTIFSNLGRMTIADRKFDLSDFISLLETDNQNVKAANYESAGNNAEKAADSERLANNTAKALVYRKYYYINNTYYLFEPLLAGQKIVVSFDQNKGKDLEPFIFPGFEKVQYMFSCNQKALNDLFLKIDNVTDASAGKLMNTFALLEEEMKSYFPHVFNNTCCILDDAAQSANSDDIYRSLLLYSFLMQVTKKSYFFEEFLKLSLESNELTRENRYFIWNQCKRYQFTAKVSGNAETRRMMKELYQKAYDAYYEDLKSELKPVPIEERDPNLIVVFTIQFLSERHAPTRSTLERCYTLAKMLGKKILLINTKEQYTGVGQVLVYQPSFGNVINEFNNLSAYQYKDLQIPYFQPSDDMPSLPVMKAIVKKIKEIKPYFIFSIGDGSITADICGTLVPEASIGVVFSGFTTTKATFHVIGKRIADGEWEELISRGFTKESIIESTFTFELNPKKRTICRDDLNIPKDRFILVTVGIRLDADLNDDYFKMLQNTYSWGTHVVFAGNFSRYDYYCEKYPDLKEHSTFIGYYDDMLALMEICDLYINPIRLGGGFSIIEAFHEGKPGITVRFGDVSVAAGSDFCVKDYQEMAVTIKRYIEDKEFYNAMAKKAIEREKVVTDSAMAMEEIIRKIQESPLFF